MPRRSPLVVRVGLPGNQPGPSSIERPPAPDGCLRRLDEPSSCRQDLVVVLKPVWTAVAALLHGSHAPGTQTPRDPEPDVRARDAYLRG
jgi:hypothetical protein